jgi:hypothetical protein
MHDTETLRSIAVKLRKLSEDTEEELAAQLVNLASEYERMASQVQPPGGPSLPLWGTDAA